MRRPRVAAPSSITTITVIASAGHFIDRRDGPRARLPLGEGMTIVPTPDSPLVGAFLPSPNHGERRGFARPDSVVLHYTGMATGQGALDLLRDPNSASIGVEIVNPGHDAGLPPFPQVQIEATIALCRDIVSRRAISPERILAHSDIAPTRKRDPGERFPWAVLARAGVGHWVEPAPIGAAAAFGRAQEGPHIRSLQALLALYGYGVEMTGVYDRTTEIVVTAFQRHFRPEKVDGQPDESTIATLRALIEGLGR